MILSHLPVSMGSIGGYGDIGEVDAASRAGAQSCGLGTVLLGSVSHAVVQHADRPVMVVPSPGKASRRAEARGTVKSR